jgi:hypothetical protein
MNGCAANLCIVSGRIAAIVQELCRIVFCVYKAPQVGNNTAA